MPGIDRRPRRALLRLVIVTAAVLGFALPAHAGATAKGLNVDLTWGTTEADQDRTIAAIEDSGAKWVRIEIDWQWLDASWDTTGWEWGQERILAHYDRAIRLADEAGLRILLMVQRSPRSASGSTIHEAPRGTRATSAIS